MHTLSHSPRSCGQRDKAAGLLEHMDPGQAGVFWRRLALAHAAAAGGLAEAERCWLRARGAGEAVAMYLRAGECTQHASNHGAGCRPQRLLLCITLNTSPLAQGMPPHPRNQIAPC